MLSSNQNVEAVASLLESAKRYAELQLQLLKLGGVEKTVQISKLLFMLIMFLFMFFFAMMFLSAAVVCALAPYMGLVWALLLVAGVHIGFFVLLLVFRETFIERPLVKLLMAALN